MKRFEYLWSAKLPVVTSDRYGNYVSSVPTPIVFTIHFGSTFMAWSSQIYYSSADTHVLQLLIYLTDITDDRAIIAAPVSFRFELIAKDEKNLTAICKNESYQRRNEQMTCSFSGVENQNFLFGINVKRFLIKCFFELSDDWFKDLNPLKVVTQPEAIPKVVSELLQQAVSRSDSVSFTDVTLISSDGDEFFCHSCFLASQSTVLKSVLDNQSLENGKRVIKFNDVDSATLLEVLRYVYTEIVGDNLTPLASKVLYAAEKYLLSDVLKDRCHKALLDSLKVENVIEYLLVAENYGLKQLKVASIDVIVHNLAAVRKQDNWFSFLREHPFLVDEVFEAVCEKKISVGLGALQ